MPPEKKLSKNLLLRFGQSSIVCWTLVMIFFILGMNLEVNSKKNVTELGFQGEIWFSGKIG